MLKEFREFAVKGNMIELAVGIIIGAAFTGVVNSLVKDLITPLIGLVWNADFKNVFVVIKGPAGNYPTVEDAAKAGAVTLNYGMFVTTLINFLIVAFAVFLLVKAINKLRREPAPADEVPPAPSEEVMLLTEIRDSLKAK
jgi:large conductance mechanosensitive channel